ncbi:MAG: hypothetical protein ACI9MC_001835, partial [Kiritimatiellia bacterium]
GFYLSTARLVGQTIERRALLCQPKERPQDKCALSMDFDQTSTGEANVLRFSSRAINTSAFAFAEPPQRHPPGEPGLNVFGEHHELLAVELMLHCLAGADQALTFA